MSRSSANFSSETLPRRASFTHFFFKTLIYSPITYQEQVPPCEKNAYLRKNITWKRLFYYTPMFADVVLWLVLNTSKVTIYSPMQAIQYTKSGNPHLLDYRKRTKSQHRCYSRHYVKEKRVQNLPIGNFCSFPQKFPVEEPFFGNPIRQRTLLSFIFLCPNILSVCARCRCLFSKKGALLSQAATPSKFVLTII